MAAVHIMGSISQTGADGSFESPVGTGYAACDVGSV
jgi:hypothetical protein